MADTSDVVWLVGRSEEIGVLQETLDGIDATIEETWPTDVNAGIIALVRVGTADADAAAEAIGTEAPVFDTEESARGAAQKLASS